MLDVSRLVRQACCSAHVLVKTKYLVLSGFIEIEVIRKALICGCMDVQMKMPLNPRKALSGGGFDPPGGR